jgi:hypothetical protein
LIWIVSKKLKEQKMKPVRLFSIVMAVVLLAVAVIPFAAASAGSVVSAAVSSPARAFADAALGLPLLAPMSVSMPAFSFSVENIAASKSYACSFISQTPKDWSRMRPRQDFDMEWTVQNTGGLTWHASSIAIKYLGGTKMQTRGNKASLSDDVGAGKKTTLIVDMNAPKAPGTYTALWSLVAGKQNFCKVTLILTVTR